jgi:large subunit ribosomal protein L4
MENGIELEYDEPQFARLVFERNRWGNAHGRSLVITNTIRPNLFEAMKPLGDQGRVLERSDVDVKDLLEMGRVIIEKAALNKILNDHQSDLIVRG